MWDTGSVDEALTATNIKFYGCFFLNQKQPLSEPVAVSGAPCPGYVKAEGRFQQSVLRQLMEKNGGQHLGIPLAEVRAIQLEIRESESRKKAALEGARAEQQQRHAEQQRIIDNKVNDLAAQLGFTDTSDSNHSSPDGDGYIEPVRQAKPVIGRGVRPRQVKST